MERRNFGGRVEEEERKAQENRDRIQNETDGESGRDVNLEREKREEKDRETRHWGCRIKSAATEGKEAE